ncbi:Zinc finger and SCAN domain-containing protein 2 [Portunus trituberculatus]|uniref:Zinc finger and SCAN domain-containing protein 2 n=1 Tax=Portunus trituberculatus TaxID=210409 RepID=A0A5B7DD45_PORTR|nr:Zinc finger and SCAN domain-containing protein 2 [Portunus trituberculatus]
MEHASPSLRLWNQKLSEILKLAGELQNEDQKLAAESWYLAVHHIQSLWGKTSLSTTKKDVSSQVEEVKQDGHRSEAASSLVLDGRVWKRSTTLQIQTSTPKEEAMKEECCIEEQNSNKVKRGRREGKKSSKSSVKQEAQVKQESESQDKAQDAGKVQSVHLMISADPVLVPSMNRFKKVFKNEDTGKMETIYQCEKCPKQCRSAIALYKHWSSHSKSLECPICHQILCNRHALNAHKRTHTGERPFECTKCSSRFTTRGNLARHIASHEGKKPWQCALCGKRFTEKKSLKVHMRTHTGEKPYACSVCPKKFSQSGILQAHMLIHTNQYAHLCDICGRSFRQRSQLATHHLRHQGVRPFSCPNCDRNFTTKGDMERHLRTHTGERPFSCDVCGASFARPQTLQEHRNRHFNFKPYMCKICSKRFHEMAACTRHIKGLHSREKGNAPASASVLRLTNPEHQQGTNEEEKQSILITHLDVTNPETKEEDIPPATPQEDVEGNEEEEEEEEEEMEGVAEEDGEEVKHHIFVMHTTEPEETQLITIGEPTGSDEEVPRSTEVSCDDCVTLMSSMDFLRSHARHCTAVSCENCRTLISSVEMVRGHMRLCDNHQEWLMEDDAMSQDSNGSSDRNSVDGEEAEGSGDAAAGGNGEDEVVTSDLDHQTVTISEDVTITSLPLTQLPPIHLQLESDYMVVLREPASNGQTADRTLPPQQVEEHSLTEAEEENSQPRLALVSSLLNE